MRAIAILLVVESHAAMLVGLDHQSYPWLVPVDGVDVFFVLSGFLIGSILVRQFEGTSFDTTHLLSFWSRRWLRTLPAYFTMLIVLAVLQGLLSNHWRFPLRYVLFLQNLASPHPVFFGEAWSLSIEEWFYLLVPLLLYLLARTPVKRRLLLGVVPVAVICAVILVRLHRWSLAPDITAVVWRAQFRKEVVTRLDAIMFGMMAAISKVTNRERWVSGRFFALGLGVAIVTANQVWEQQQGDHYGLYPQVFEFSLLAMGFALMLPAADQWRVAPRWGTPITFISAISYSMYLMNWQFNYQFVSTSMLQNIGAPTVLRLPTFIVGSFVFPIALYAFVELPFMRLRDRIFPAKETGPTIASEPLSADSGQASIS